MDDVVATVAAYLPDGDLLSLEHWLRQQETVQVQPAIPLTPNVEAQPWRPLEGALHICWGCCLFVFCP